jgi:NADH-quinone oxidoreductase subunit N
MSYSYITLLSNSLKVTIPEIFLVVAISIILLFGLVYQDKSIACYSNKKITTTSIIGWQHIGVFLIVAILYYNSEFPEATIFNGILINQSYANIFKIFLVLSSFIVLIMSYKFLEYEKLDTWEYYTLVSLATLGLLLLLSSNDLISTYLALELMSLSLYVIATLRRNSEFSNEAGLKYFVLGAFSSGLILFGSSLLYGFTGSTSFEDIKQIINLLQLTNFLDEEVSLALLIGLIFFGIGLLFKLAAAPFHMWCPDVYEGAPTSVTAFFAIVPKLGVLVFFIHFFQDIAFEFFVYWKSLLVFSCILSIIVSSFAAINQKHIKRILAYSGIGHVGYILIGFIAGTIEGIEAIFIYTFIYMIMNISFFALLMSIYGQGKDERIRFLTDFKFLTKSNPVIAATFAMLVLSLAGVPPLAGFISKLYIFIAAVNVKLYFLAVIAIVTSCVGAYYYIRFIKVMYFEKNMEWNNQIIINKENSLIISYCTLYIMLFFIWPTHLLLLSKHLTILMFI